MNENKKKKPVLNKRKSWQKEITKRSSLAMSVFGKAPTLETMRKMNQISKSHDSLFRGAEFWYRFRLYYFYIHPLCFVLGLILSITLWNTIEGHMITGGLISLISCLTIVASYLMIIPWRKHPSTMVLYRAITNIFFSLAVIFMAVGYHINEDAPCGGYPEFFHFFLLASEGWLTTIALDLYYSLTNPFTSYKVNMRRYHGLVWFLSFTITFALYNQPSCQARVQGGLCWLRINSVRDSCLWGYYFFWIICMYGFQFTALLFAYQRLKKGLPITFDIRKKCALETFQCLGFFATYLLLLGICFVILISSQPVHYSDTSSSSSSSSSNSSWMTFGNIFLYLVSCRGYVDGLVWFKQHDFARDNQTSIVMTATGGGGGDGDDGEGEGGGGGVGAAEGGKVGQEEGELEKDLEGNQSTYYANNEHQMVPEENFLEGLEGIHKGRQGTGAEGMKIFDAMNDLGESAVMSFDEADLSPQVGHLPSSPLFPHLSLSLPLSAGEHGTPTTNCEICDNGCVTSHLWQLSS
jgi:hypothetical protein